MLLPMICGWCYCQYLMADVVAICGWCLCHLLIVVVLADVIAKADVLTYVADGIATFYVMGWCYCPVADGIAT